MEAATLLKQARREAGLTQAELAARLGKQQTTIASLERRRSNPTVRTLDRALRALGQQLELRAVPVPPGLDEAQIVAQLRLTPAERAKTHDRAYRNVRELVGGSRRLR
jgi:transcriptional regulator with XRE-family HTH domain